MIQVLPEPPTHGARDVLWTVWTPPTHAASSPTFSPPAAPSSPRSRPGCGRDPHDKTLHDLIGELSTRSELFRTRWASHNVRLHHTGVKHLRHPVVGALTLDYDAMELPADTGLTVITYSAEPASPSADNLRLLASWAATLDQASQTPEQSGAQVPDQA